MKKVIGGEKHFTASVWIVSKSKPKKLLLVHHKKFNKWIQPGGHIEKKENPIEAAIRETHEETGIDIRFLRKFLWRTSDNVTEFLRPPDFLLEQKIPQYKSEPEHFHLDMQYIVKVDEQTVKHSIRESHEIGWFTKKEALKLPIHKDTKMIIKEIL